MSLNMDGLLLLLMMMMEDDDDDNGDNDDPIASIKGGMTLYIFGGKYSCVQRN